MVGMNMFILPFSKTVHASSGSLTTAASSGTLSSDANSDSDTDMDCMRVTAKTQFQLEVGGGRLRRIPRMQDFSELYSLDSGLSACASVDGLSSDANSDTDIDLDWGKDTAKTQLKFEAGQGQLRRIPRVHDFTMLYEVDSDNG